MSQAGAGGVFVPVVGPSGVGKDSLIAGARALLAGDPRFVFARRVVTRSDGGNEDHDSLDADAFAAAEAAGAYCLAWRAHGLSYGIPAAVSADVEAGKIVVANLSRGALAMARGHFPRVTTVAVTAPRERLVERLAGRGRESAADIEARLLNALRPVTGPDVVEIDNGGALDAAVDRMVALLRRL